jgi:hypothetical protein
MFDVCVTGIKELCWNPHGEDYPSFQLEGSISPLLREVFLMF